MSVGALLIVFSLPERLCAKNMTEPELLRALFDHGLDAVDACRATLANLPTPPERGSDRIIVQGAGKAAARMAHVVGQAWAHVPIEGLVVTRYGHGAACSGVRVLEEGIPTPRHTACTRPRR